MVVPILIQQAIDKGILVDDDGDTYGVRVRSSWPAPSSPSWRCAIAAVCQRTAVVRLGMRSEQALNDLRTRLIDHIHRISLADHNDERRGALVARVTSDIETLAEFFRWGGLAWLIDGTLMVIVAAVMLAYNWLLALIAIAISIPLFFVLRIVQRHLVTAYDTARERNGEMLGAVSEVVSGAETIRAYDAGADVRHAARSGPCDGGPTPRSAATSSARSCSRSARCSRSSRSPRSSPSAWRSGPPAG